MMHSLVVQAPIPWPHPLAMHPSPASAHHPGPAEAAAGRTRQAARGSSPFSRFRGWAVVAGAFTVQAICFAAIYSIPAFAEPLRVSFGASDASDALIYTVSGAMTFGVGAVSGPLADRFGTRLPVTLGMAIVAVGFLLATRAQSFVEVQLCYGLLVGLGAGLAYVPALAVVPRWFESRRGLASGIATAGVGFGTMMVPALDGLLRTTGGWQAAFLVVAAGTAVLGIGAAQLLGGSPAGRDLPRHEMAGCGLTTTGRRDPGGLAAALRDRRFPCLLGGCVLLSGPVGLPFVDLAVTARDKGLDPGDAIWLISLVGAGSMFGRLALGPLADRLGRSPVLLACCAGVAGAMAFWATATNPLDFAGFALGFGIVQGGFAALLPSAAVDLYGPRCAGGVLGILFAGRALAVLLTPPCVAALSPGMGHAAMLWTMGGMALLGTALIARALLAQPSERKQPLALPPPRSLR